MDRLTIRNSDGAWDVPLRNDNGVYIPSQEVIDRLAAYEDTGLEPEQCAKYAQAEKEGRYILLKDPGTAGVHSLEEIARADIEGRLLVLPCGDDVTLEYNGLLYKGDHWNPPTLTAFASDPSTRSGLRVHCFGIEEAEKALKGMNNDVR